MPGIDNGSETCPGLREDYAACGGLKHTGHLHFLVRVDVAPATLDDYHGAVVEISDTLPGFLAFLHDVDSQVFARQIRWT